MGAYSNKDDFGVAKV